MSRPGPWTPERISQLKELWAEGWSCSQIAEALGGGIGRCAVAGKISRLNLPLRGGHYATKKRGIPKMAQPMPEPPPPSPPVPPHSALPMVELAAHHCRYPVTDGAPWLFCARFTQAGSVYCPSHMRLCYAPQKREAA